MSGKTINALIESTLKGNFQDVQNSIEYNKLQLESPSAIQILVAICNACHNNLPSLDESALISLIKCVLKFIKAPTDEQFEKYLQSTSFILKFLINKKNSDGIVQLEVLVVPDFMPLNLTEKQHVLYTSICKSVYNFIAILTQTKDKAQTKNVHILCYVMLKVYKKLNKKDTWFEFIYNCIAALIRLNISPERIAQFYQELISSTNLNENPEIYNLVIKNLRLVYTYLLDKKALKIASQCYKSAVVHLSTLKGTEYGLLIDIMNIVELFNPDNFNSMTRQVFSRATSDLIKYQKLYNSTPKLKAVCDFISFAVSSALFFYKENNIWLEYIEIHCYFYEFLYNVSCILVKTTNSGTCKCSTETDQHGAIRVLYIISGLGRLSILNGNDVSSEYKKYILFCLEKFSEHVATLKMNNCGNWKKLWSDLVVPLYSIGLDLFKKGDTPMSVLYLEKFVKDFLDFEGSQSKTTNKSYLKSSLYMIATVHFRSHDFEKCLLVTALSIIMCESRRPEINHWIKAKYELRENEPNQKMLELTLVSICQKYKKDRICVRAGINLSKQQKIDLLVYELRQYQSKWKSKIPMAAAFKELYQVADLTLIADIFIEIWGDGKTTVHDDIPRMLKETIRRIEKDQVPKKELLLAHLYFMQHKYRVKDTVLKHCDEMEESMFTKSTHEDVESATDRTLKDECDLISSYEPLELDRYIGMLEKLYNSLRFSDSWVSKNTIDEIDAERLLPLLANLGHEFCLHGLKTKCLQAWELALKVATATKNALYRLVATGFILELVDPRKPLMKKMVSEAEEEIGTLKHNQKFEELIIYFLCKADAYLYVDFKTADSAFQEALLLQKDYQCNAMVEAHTKLMHHKFIVVLPCHYSVEGHRQFSLVKIYDAVCSVHVRYSLADFLTSYDMRIFFDVYENMAKWYYNLYQPLEARGYTRIATIIAQKMILPIRAMSFLYYLTYADIITHRLDDARVKIKGFSNMLSLEDQPVNTVRRNDTQDVDILVEELKEMTLELPRRDPPISSNGGSPTFAVESFETPSFLTHEGNCDCWYCINLEYQEFVIKETFLKAMLSQYENNLPLTKDFFYGCLKIYECLNQREKNYTRKTQVKVSHDLVPVVSERLMETHLVILKEYANFLIRDKRLAQAEKINRKVSTKIESLSLQTKFVYIYHEVLLQALNILSFQEEPTTTSNLLRVETQDTSIKTPPSRKTTVQVSPNWTRTEPTKIKVLPKSLKFDLSDEDVPKPTKKAQPKDLPFLNLGTATPAPSCSRIKIYTNGSTTKKTKSVPAVPTPFKEPNLGTTEKKANPELALRTKLLTERLKDSSRKGSVKKTDQKASVKQNLLKQLDEADAKPTEVRRSARNKK